MKEPGAIFWCSPGHGEPGAIIRCFPGHGEPGVSIRCFPGRVEPGAIIRCFPGHEGTQCNFLVLAGSWGTRFDYQMLPGSLFSSEGSTFQGFKGDVTLFGPKASLGSSIHSECILWCSCLTISRFRNQTGLRYGNRFGSHWANRFLLHKRQGSNGTRRNRAISRTIMVSLFRNRDISVSGDFEWYIGRDISY